MSTTHGLRSFIAGTIAVVAATVPVQLWGQQDAERDAAEPQAMHQHMQQDHMQQHPEVLQRMNQLFDRSHRLSEEVANRAHVNGSMGTENDRQMLQQMGVGMEALTAQMLAWTEHLHGTMRDRGVAGSPDLEKAVERLGKQMGTMVQHVEGAIEAMEQMCELLESKDQSGS